MLTSIGRCSSNKFKDTDSIYRHALVIDCRLSRTATYHVEIRIADAIHPVARLAVARVAGNFMGSDVGAIVVLTVARATSLNYE